jgi:hypothetical protein
MAVNKKIRELQEKRERILLGGGEQAIEKQKAMGKRTARERIMKTPSMSMTFLLSTMPAILIWIKNHFQVMEL